MKRKKRDLSAENINRFIDHFVEVYPENGPTNELPEKGRFTAWCSNGSPSNSGFAVNVTINTIGLNALIALKWIKQTTLNKLIDEN